MVFRKGIPAGLTGKLLILGNSLPVSTTGTQETWKKAQKKAPKKQTSDNKKIKKPNGKDIFDKKLSPLENLNLSRYNQLTKLAVYLKNTTNKPKKDTQHKTKTDIAKTINVEIEKKTGLQLRTSVKIGATNHVVSRKLLRVFNTMLQKKLWTFIIVFPPQEDQNFQC